MIEIDGIQVTDDEFLDALSEILNGCYDFLDDAELKSLLECVAAGTLSVEKALKILMDDRDIYLERLQQLEKRKSD